MTMNASTRAVWALQKNNSGCLSSSQGHIFGFVSPAASNACNRLLMKSSVGERSVFTCRVWNGCACQDFANTLVIDTPRLFIAHNWRVNRRQPVSWPCNKLTDWFTISDKISYNAIVFILCEGQYTQMLSLDVEEGGVQRDCESHERFFLPSVVIVLTHLTINISNSRKRELPVLVEFPNQTLWSNIRVLFSDKKKLSRGIVAMRIIARRSI